MRAVTVTPRLLFVRRETRCPARDVAAREDHAVGQPCGRGQPWLVPARFSTPTPTMIRAIPTIARPLNRSPNSSQAPTAAPAVPNPDHVAYASPTPIGLRTIKWPRE